MQLNQATLALLVCPVCHGALHLAATHIDCTACGRHYPIIDNLPVLISSRATLPVQSGE